MNTPPSPFRRNPRWFTAVLLVVVVALLPYLMGSPASAATAPVPLGTAAPFAVLAGSAVTNTGPSVVSGDLGVSPGTAITGFPPGTLLGVQHSADPVAAQAQADLTIAYNSAAGRPADAQITTDLGGQILVPGIYHAAGGIGLTGTVTLDAGNDPDAVFIFQAGTTLITGTRSRVNLIRGAQACNVFWQVGSSATLGTETAFAGNILAMESITLVTEATVDGRALARTGAVTLDTNTVIRPLCTVPVVTTTTLPGQTTTTTLPGQTTTTTLAPTTTTTLAPTTTTTLPGQTTTTTLPGQTTTTTLAPTTTTTLPGQTTTTTRPGQTTTTTLLGGTTTTQQAGSTTSSSSSTTSTASTTSTSASSTTTVPTVLGATETGTTGPDVNGTDQTNPSTLPTTGGRVGGALLLACAALLAGALALRLGRRGGASS